MIFTRGFHNLWLTSWDAGSHQPLRDGSFLLTSLSPSMSSGAFSYTKSRQVTHSRNPFWNSSPPACLFVCLAGCVRQPCIMESGNSVGRSHMKEETSKVRFIFLVIISAPHLQCHKCTFCHYLVKFKKLTLLTFYFFSNIQEHNIL